MPLSLTSTHQLPHDRIRERPFIAIALRLLCVPYIDHQLTNAAKLRLRLEECRMVDIVLKHAAFDGPLYLPRPVQRLGILPEVVGKGTADQLIIQLLLFFTDCKKQC